MVVAPGHPASNGAAENSVKSFKKGLRAAISCAKAQNLSTDLDLVAHRYLFDYRNSIHFSIQEKPSRAMLGREIRTRFSLMKPLTVEENIDASLAIQQRNFKGHRDVSFDVGTSVMIRDYTNPNHASWAKAQIVEVLGSREYNCQTEKGRIIKRHLDQMFPFELLQTDKSDDVNASNVNIESEADTPRTIVPRP